MYLSSEEMTRAMQDIHISNSYIQAKIFGLNEHWKDSMLNNEWSKSEIYNSVS